MNIEAFSKMRGRDMIALGREGFLAKAPPYTGDILWEHLEILQKGTNFTNFNIYIYFVDCNIDSRSNKSKADALPA